MSLTKTPEKIVDHFHQVHSTQSDHKQKHSRDLNDQHQHIFNKYACSIFFQIYRYKWKDNKFYIQSSG